MIYCKKANIEFYLGVERGVDTAIYYLKGACLERLPFGRNEIDGERVYLNHFEYDTKDEEELLYEAHGEYADIHLIIEGQERILCAVESELEEVESDLLADYIGLKGTATSEYHMTSEDVLIVFPHEAHKVKCTDGTPSHVNKAVIKVKVHKE